MSIRAIGWAFEQKCNSSTAKLVLLKLADNANDQGYCWPSMDYIAAHCEISRRSVIDNIKRLSDIGLVKIEHRFFNGVQIPNVYRLGLRGDVGVVNHVHPQGALNSTGRVNHVHTEPSEETVIKPKRRKTPLDNFKKWESESKSADPNASLVELVGNLAGAKRLQ